VIQRNSTFDDIFKVKYLYFVGSPEGVPVDDDGFESLNGNGSSDEPTVSSKHFCEEDVSEGANSTQGNASVSQLSQNNNNSSDNLDSKPSVILDEEEFSSTSDKDGKSKVDRSNVKDRVRTLNYGDEEPLKPFPLSPKLEDVFPNGEHVSSSNLLQRRRSGETLSFKLSYSSAKLMFMWNTASQWEHADF